MTDLITGLNDRQEFFKILHNNVIQANENNGKLALLVIQINRFQRINEVNGFDGGDAALHYVGQKLTEIKREQDHIARISDTKFALILNKILNKGHAQLAAHKVIRVLEVPLDYEDKQIKIGVSIGVSLCPSHSSVPMGLYKKSEEALKLAKLHEKSIGITPDDTGFEISDFWDIELGIEQALNESQFQLYYQPKLSLKTGKPIGAEALIRWPHPSRGMIRPDQFIPIAEQFHYIKPITIWILNVALRESSEWTEQWGPLSISANIPPELMDAELVDLVDNALNIWEPENITLVLEILERSFAETGEDSFVVFEALQKLGAEISIDDFGTGYSALSYFKSIPAKELKVDQSFVLKLLDEKGNFDIVKLIINLAHAFNMRVVAEGVEDYKSLMVLKELGCDYIQGYYLARPMPHKEFVQWLLDFKGIEVPEGAEEITYNNEQASIPEDGEVWHELAETIGEDDTITIEQKSSHVNDNNTKNSKKTPPESIAPQNSSPSTSLKESGLIDLEHLQSPSTLPETIELESNPIEHAPLTEEIREIGEIEEIEIIKPEVKVEAPAPQVLTESPIIEKKETQEEDKKRNEDGKPNENDIDFGEPLI